MLRTLPTRWAALGVLILGALFAVTSVAAAQDSSADFDSARGVRVQVHSAKLTATDAATCARRPAGRVISKQVINPAADPHRAVLNVGVTGLHCRGGDELTVVIRGDGETVRVGTIAIDNNGNGRASFATGAGDPIPVIGEGDVVALVAVNDIHGAFPIVSGEFHHRLTYFAR